MKKTALNSWRSWIIAGACCLAYCLFVVVYRLSSLFYVALIEQNNLERKYASIPFAAMGFVRAFSGFIFGILGERFGLQRIIFFSCFLCVLGVGASYFDQNIPFLSITLGLIYGFGMTSTALLPNIIRKHFDDTATTISNGLVNLGPCLAAIVFPSIVVHMTEEYGVSGLFLLSSGVILNAVPFIMLLKTKSKPSKLHTLSIEDETNQLHIKQDQNLEDLCLQKISLNEDENFVNPSFAGENRHMKLVEDNSSIIKITSTSIGKKNPKWPLHCHGSCSCSNMSPVESNYDLQNPLNSHVTEKISPNKQTQSEKYSKPLANNSCHQPKYEIPIYSESKNPKIIHQQDNAINNSTNLRAVESKSFFYVLNVFKDPTFMVLTIIQGVFGYTFNIWLTTMIDYSRDKKIDRSFEIYILTLNPITDMIGRLSLTWVTDKGYLSVSSFGAVLFILFTISSICMALANGFAIMTLGVLIMTFTMGAFLNICPGMSYAFIEKDKQRFTIASFGLLYAPFSISVSPLIGYFRGKLGSYDGLYYLVAVMNFACSLIVLSLPKLANMRERRKLKESRNDTALKIS